MLSRKIQPDVKSKDKYLPQKKMSALFEKTGKRKTSNNAPMINSAIQSLAREKECLKVYFRTFKMPPLLILVAKSPADEFRVP